MKVRIKPMAHKNHLLSTIIPCYIKPDRSGLVETYAEKEYRVVKRTDPKGRIIYVTTDGLFLLEDDIEITDDTIEPDHVIIRQICQNRLELLSAESTQDPENGYYLAGLRHSVESILKMLDILYGQAPEIGS